MNRIIALLAALIGTTAAAQSVQMCELNRFAMEGYRILNHRDGYFPYSDEQNEHWRYGTAALFDMDLVRYGDYGLSLSNRVHGESTVYQFREVGWEYEVTAQLGRKLDVYWHHHSRHILDAEPNDRYPLDNQIGARITFFDKK